MNRPELKSLKILATFLALVFVCSLMAVAQQPKFKGNLGDFFKSKLVYPDFSAQHCVQGRVNISFKLNAKGEVIESKVTKGIIGDLNDEALRLIKLTSGKWLIPQGYDEISTIVVPVNFSLDNQDCRYQNQDQINLAIAEYYKEEQLTKAVYNFYKAKEANPALKSDEGKFIKIKQELGIDDDYLEQRLKTAQKKIKQGDTEGACDDFKFVKYMGSNLADKYLEKYCK